MLSVLIDHYVYYRDWVLGGVIQAGLPAGCGNVIQRVSLSGNEGRCNTPQAGDPCPHLSGQHFSPIVCGAASRTRFLPHSPYLALIPVFWHCVVQLLLHPKLLLGLRWKSQTLGFSSIIRFEL